MHDGTEVAPADAYLLSTLDGGLVSDYFEKYFLSLTCTLYSHSSLASAPHLSLASYMHWHV